MNRLIVFLVLFTFMSTCVEAKKRVKKGYDVYWELKNGTLTISGNGNMPDWGWSRAKDAPWYKSRKKIVNVVIDPGVTSIGNHTFYIDRYGKDYAIRNVTIPKTIKRIGDAAFLSCKNLSGIYITDLSSWCNIDFSSTTGIFPHLYLNGTELKRVEIPDGIKEIKYRAFGRLTGIISVKIPSSVTSIGIGAFADCSNLTSISIPSSVTSIKSSAFSYCRSLKSISIPSSVTAIDRLTFFNCKSLEAISIPSSVTSIGDRAFEGCESLASISIPKSVKSIGKDAFKGFSGKIKQLPDFVVNSDNPWQWGLSGNEIDRYKKGVKDEDGVLILEAKNGRKISNFYSDSSGKYYLIEESGKKGILASDGEWKIPLQNLSDISLINEDYMMVKDALGLGVYTLEGTIIIPTKREYTSISFNETTKKFAYSKKGYKGTCDTKGREIDTERLPPSADDVKRMGGYASASLIENGSAKYYRVSKNGHYGITDSWGHEIIPPEMDAIESISDNLFKFSINGYWGVMTSSGNVIIPTSRGYTSIGNYVKSQKIFPYTMDGYKGECDNLGKEISRVKTSTPQNSTVSSGGSSSGSSSSSGNKTTTVVVKHEVEKQQVQVWHDCMDCGGSGQCRYCNSNGMKWYGNSYEKCVICNGWNRCQTCHGNRGYYTTEWR